MYWYHRALLIGSVLWLFATPALAQDLGMGMGLPEQQARKGTGGTVVTCSQGRLDFSGTCSTVLFVMALGL